MTNRIVYVGYSDPEQGKTKWRPIADTPEALRQAISDGFTGVTTTSFSFEPERGKDEPNRRGSLFLDFDAADNPELGIKFAQTFLRKIIHLSCIDANFLRYWMSGGKGCHIEIPASLLGSDEGHQYLPEIYKYMVITMLVKTGMDRFNHIKNEVQKKPIIDLNMYCMGKGKLLRIENIERPNGKYKVPLTAKEFFGLDYNELTKLTYQPRLNFDSGFIVASANARLECLYAGIKKAIEGNYIIEFNKLIEQISKCAFLSYCLENSATLGEPEWWCMISNLLMVGPKGTEYVHMFSHDHPQYSYEDTEKKIQNALKQNMPKTCKYIHDTFGHICPGTCDIHAPYKLFTIKEICKHSGRFDSRDDGLYVKNDEGKWWKVCSPIKVVAKCKDWESRQWSRIVRVTAPDGNITEMLMPMKMFGESGNKWLTELLDAGLEFESFGRVSMVKDYITCSIPDSDDILLCNKIGWTPDNTYVLPYKHFGSKKEIVYRGKTSNMFDVLGTLEDWQKNIGIYCSGNPLLVLATSYALTGTLLSPLALEGGGIHIYGPSSKGKSTISQVAGSVCGGSAKGFVVQWRATDNAIEAIAAAHNDNFLVLDEVSQANSSMVYKTVYMLCNEQGKQRMTQDCNSRKTFTWKLNFLTNGEITIGDKIMEDGKLTPLTGQEVRIIDLPIIGENFENPLQQLHGCENPKILSDLLRKNTKFFYGSPLQAFLQKLVDDRENTLNVIIRAMDAFYVENIPDVRSSQVERVCTKFALISVVGELAIEWGIFPYQRGEADNAAKDWFNIWMNNRNSLNDGELAKLCERIRTHFETFGHKYIPLPGAHETEQSYCPGGTLLGYRYYEGCDEIYFAIASTCNELFRNVNRQWAIAQLVKKGWLALRNNGKVLDTKSIKDRTVRGLGFIVSEMK